MTETLANILDVTKEVWTQDRLEKQFYDGHRWLDRVERTNKYTIGREAKVPLETSLPGGTTSLSSAGGSLNSADELHVDVANYTIQYIYQQVELQVAAMNQADSVGSRSTIDAVDQTVVSNVLALRKDINRQAVSNGDAIIAACDTGGASTTVELLASGYGYDAIRRGWLRPGVSVDIGSAANETSIAADRTITAVKKSASDPDITISGGTVSTVSGTDFVSIANARSGATSNEINGLRTIVGSTSTAIGGLDPDTAGEEFWQPASVDTTTTLVSLDLLLDLQREVYQETGKWPKYVTTGPKQASELYALFQNQVRFSSDSPSAGNVEGFKWNGIEITLDPDIPDRELYVLDLEAFFVVTGGRIGKPTWMSELAGNSRLDWVQGSTRFADAVAYPLNIAVKRRNSSAAAIGLTA